MCRVYNHFRLDIGMCRVPPPWIFLFTMLMFVSMFWLGWPTSQVDSNLFRVYLIYIKIKVCDWIFECLLLNHRKTLLIYIVYYKLEHYIEYFLSREKCCSFFILHKNHRL